MNELLAKIEAAAVHYDPVVLVTAGLIAVGAGLVLWIAGLNITKAAAVLFGGSAGAVAGYYLAAENRLAGIFFGAAAAALISIIFDKTIIIFIGSVVISALGVLLLVLRAAGGADVSGFPDSAGRLTQSETIDAVGRQMAYFADKAHEAAGLLPGLAWPGAILLAILLLVLGFVFVRLLVAVSCSSIGTALIFFGMTLLLLYKGAAPLTHMYNRAYYFFAVFGIMVAFGTVVQLALCRPRPQRITTGDSSQQQGLSPVNKHVQGDVQ